MVCVSGWVLCTNHHVVVVRNYPRQFSKTIIVFTRAVPVYPREHLPSGLFYPLDTTGTVPKAYETLGTHKILKLPLQDKNSVKLRSRFLEPTSLQRVYEGINPACFSSYEQFHHTYIFLSHHMNICPCPHVNICFSVIIT